MRFLERVKALFHLNLKEGDGSKRPLSRGEIFAAGNIAPEPSEKYLKRIEMLDNVVRDCIAVSREYAGIASPTPKHFYASVLFTSLISRAVSLTILAPHTPWAKKLIEHWDYASASIIVRTMIEIRAAFHYLCVDVCSEAEWNCRWNLLNLHGCISRRRLLESKEGDEEQVRELEGQADELRDRLRTNAHFMKSCTSEEITKWADSLFVSDRGYDREGRHRKRIVPLDLHITFEPRPWSAHVLLSDGATRTWKGRTEPHRRGLYVSLSYAGCELASAHPRRCSIALRGAF